MCQRTGGRLRPGASGICQDDPNNLYTDFDGMSGRLPADAFLMRALFLFILLTEQECLKTLEQKLILPGQGLLMGFEILRVFISQTEQIVRGDVIQLADGDQGFMAGRTLFLLPAAHGVQCRVQLIGQALLGVAVIAADFSKAFANHVHHSSSKYTKIYYLCDEMRILLLLWLESDIIMLRIVGDCEAYYYNRRILTKL